MRSIRPRTGTTTTLLSAPAAAAAAVLALLVLTACGGPEPEPGGGPSGPAATSPATAASVEVADSPFGRILVDDSGRTLYGFTRDKPGAASACGADCTAVWPALTPAQAVRAGSGVNASLLTRTSRREGAEQAAYGGRPLHYYVGDASPGDVNGQGLDGEWFVIGADGQLIQKAP
ncbi:hypothetical protein [Streptomyces sp. FIT100]|uniref:COG4315 family predicted lipoprotein n=1 Tax=Streptomyces sp. FIT100 TaxID=2837956 RepID=UPI0021C5D06C|nr:hypothetical protein [Streptomyces sp. FIT100]UUN27104.1 hypothetical protein KK483_12370 [Streptomyces sp. FIT100]